MSPDAGNKVGQLGARQSLRQRFFRTRASDQLPLTITHERIYILPSRRGWWFVASLLVMLIASINYSLSLGYALSFLLTGLFSATLLATYRNLSGLTLLNAKAHEVHAGEQLIWRISITANTARSDIDIASYGATIRCDLATGAESNTSSRHANQIEHRVATSVRGVQPLGRITLSSDYPLGLWYTWCYLHSPESALVLPALHPDPGAWPNQATAEPKRDAEQDNLTLFLRNMGQSGETVGLRPYRDGDSLSSIAWKNAARGQGLHVRQMVAPISSSRVEFDWEMTATAGECEARLSLLASWILAAHQRQLQWSLTLPGVALPLASGKAHVSASMRALALYNIAPQPSPNGVGQPDE